MTTITVLIIAALAIFIYKIVVEPSDKELSEKRKNDQKVSGKMIEFQRNELVFKQFHVYFADIYNKAREISNESLQHKLFKDFPHYKNGNTEELYHDLIRAELIDSDPKTGVSYKGDAFNNLRLTFPRLVTFLEGKGNLTEMFTHNIHDNYWTETANISKIVDSKIGLTYFNFGVARGSELPKELAKLSTNIENESMYLYTKTETHINLSSLNEKKLLHYDYVVLQKELLTSQYQEILNEWFSQANELLDFSKRKRN